VILVKGVWDSGITGAALSARVFETGLSGNWGDVVVTGGILLFSYSTLIGWSYYGETGAVYLFGGARRPAPSPRLAGVRVAWRARSRVGAPGMGVFLSRTALKRLARGVMDELADSSLSTPVVCR